MKLKKKKYITLSYFLKTKMTTQKFTKRTARVFLVVTEVFWVVAMLFWMVAY